MNCNRTYTATWKTQRYCSECKAKVNKENTRLSRIRHKEMLKKQGLSEEEYSRVRARKELIREKISVLHDFFIDAPDQKDIEYLYDTDVSDMEVDRYFRKLIMQKLDKN